MDHKTPLTQLKVCLLSALNGLLVGIVIEALRVAYERYRMDLYFKESIKNFGRAGYILEPTFDPLIPIVAIVGFAGVGHMIYRYFRVHQWLLSLILIFCGALSLSLHILRGTLEVKATIIYLVLLMLLSYSILKLWMLYSKSLSAFWSVISVTVVVYVFTVVQFIDLFFDQPLELRDIRYWFVCLLVTVGVTLLFSLFTKPFVQLSSFSSSNQKLEQ